MDKELQDLLKELVDPTFHGIPGGYIDMYANENTIHCTYCLNSLDRDNYSGHDSDCPIHRLQKYLEENTISNW